jgi:L-threonylcarbamoyladenylate synthase
VNAPAIAAKWRMPRKSDDLPERIALAATALQRGDLVALPTETVYGLGADATNPAAVQKIFAAKGRPADHPLIVHIAEHAGLESLAVNIPAAAHQLAAKFWPGPLTLILQRSAHIPRVVTGGQETVGIRCPAHPLAQALLEAFAKIGSGLVAAPSANKFGHVSPTSAQHVRDEFGDSVATVPGKSILLLDGGACEVGIESTILDLSRGVPVLLRPGAISRLQIRDVIGEMPLSREEFAARRGPPTGKPLIERRRTPRLANGLSAASTTLRVSGSLAAHYAPRTPLRLLSATSLAIELDGLLEQGKRVAVLAFSAKPRVKPSPVGVGARISRPLMWITADSDAVGYAQGLYANLRTLDAAATSIILVEAPPGSAAWEAVNDRLSRAAFGSGQRLDGG